MIKRPINQRFAEAIRSERKTTTIRDFPWPVRTPIMLYHWSGKPYRSKHVDLEPIIVTGFWTIRIRHQKNGKMVYTCGKRSGPVLWWSEGFLGPYDMDDWFRPLVKPGETVTKCLMQFMYVKKGNR